MPFRKFILSIDQGTTLTKTILFDRNLEVLAESSVEFSQIYPNPGWVEHDPEEILHTTLKSIEETLKKAGAHPSEIAAIGIANQGETVVAWDRTTGKPVYNAIVWQDRRTVEECEQLKNDSGFVEQVRKKTGLRIDPYFSATKIQWILKHIPRAKGKARRAELLCGTIDSWLVWNFTGGSAFVTDCSTASRTLLFNIHTLQWDVQLLRQFKINRNWLALVKPSKGEVGLTSPKRFFGEEIPVTSLLCDQQAALLGHACLQAGDAKCTYGTGAFFLLNIGDKPIHSNSGVLTSVAWNIDGRVDYLFDGGIYTAGRAVDWLRDGLEMIKDPSETELLASAVDSTEGLYFIPAFSGLAAPYWNPTARACILGLSLRTSREQIARALLEGIAFRVRDVLEAMTSSWHRKIRSLSVDGGLSQNKFLMQFQSDILGIPLLVPRMSEATSLGVAYLAGQAINLLKDKNILYKKAIVQKTYRPRISNAKRERLYSSWKKALRCAINYAS